MAEQLDAGELPGRFAAGRGLGWLALFASLPTLLCCALPIVFVALGFGASWAALYSSFPVIGVIIAHKLWIFIGSGLLLTLAAWLLWRPGQSCPPQPELARLCRRVQRWNRRLVLAGAAIWLLGFTAAYLSVPLFTLFE